METRKIKNDDFVANKMKKSEYAVKEIKNDSTENKEETNDEKMNRIMLEIINKILVLMNKKEINELCQFVDINRDELIKDEYADIIDKHKKYIFDNGYDKYICQVYQKKVANKHISILKGMLKQIGYELFSKNHKKMIKGIYHTYTLYSIRTQE